MVAVVLPFQCLAHFIAADALAACHIFDGLGKITFHLLLGDAAQRLVSRVHAYVGWLVETAEHAHLRELGHPGQQHELQVIVGGLEHRVKTFQRLAIAVFELPLMTGNINRDVGIEHVEYISTTQRLPLRSCARAST